MKTSKIFLKSEILFGILLIGAMAVCFTACDTLKEDPDVLVPDTELDNKDIYVSGNSSSLIDLSGRIRTNLPVTLSVTQSTTKGKLTTVGDLGLLRYSPDNRYASARDAFEFTIYSESHEILAKDTVVIIIEPDSTKLPCGLYPADDYVGNFKGDSVLTIDVLANDYLCGVDSADYLLNILYEGTNVVPHHGTANIVNNRIVYTPGPSYTKGDTLIYKIQSRANRLNIAFAYVYITASTISPPCNFTLRADSFQINPDTLKADTVLLPVYDNDVLCDSLYGYKLSIAKAPLYGKARLGWDGVTYEPDALPAGTSRTDSLRYQLCRDAVCRQAKVIVKVSR